MSAAEQNAQDLFEEIVNALAQMYMSGQQQMLQGLFKIKGNLEEIIDVEGLPPGVSDKKSMLRGVEYSGIYATRYKDDRNAIIKAVRDADLSALIDLVQKITGASVRNPTNIILPKKTITEAPKAPFKNLEEASNE